MVSPVSAGVVRVGKSMRQLEEVVLEVLVEVVGGGGWPGVAEISGRAGIWSGKGDAGKGEPGGVARSIAWGIVLKLFRAGLVRKCARSPGRSRYEPAELAVDRVRGMPQRFLGSASPGVVGGGVDNVVRRFVGAAGPGVVVGEVFAGPGVVVVGKACLGMRRLEEVVLEVLVEAECDGECPGVAEISRRAGIWS